MNVRMSSRKSADISLLDQGVSRRVELVGEAPEGYASVLAPLGQGSFAINGQSFDGPGLFLLESRTELEAVNNEVLRVMGMTVPTSLLRQTGRDISHTWEARDRCRTMLIQPGEPWVQRFRSLMQATIHQRISDFCEVERASALATCLATIIDRHSGSPKTTSRTRPAESVRIIRQAREFIEEHLAEPISINSVCAHSATSLSKLERTFRRELDMSPNQYILTRRLIAVNSALKISNTGETIIASLAMDFGFNHLGRFSGAYRRRFGELPSVTLRNGCAK
jgi:AraC-like DNA-binding protein